MGPAAAVVAGLVLWLAFGRLVAGGVAIGVGIISGHLVVLVPQARSAIVRTTDRFGEAVGTATSFVLLGLVHLVVLTPLGLLLRAFGAGPLGPGGGRGPDGWLEPSGAPMDRPDRLYGDDRSWRPRSGARVGDRRALVVRTVVAVVLVQALLAGTWWAIDRRMTPEPQLGGASSAAPQRAAALRDQPQIDELKRNLSQASQQLVYAPFVGSAMRDVSTPLVHVTARVRRSYQPPIPAGDRPLEVWFFGGSTMFGFDAQRDLHTIPSEFARLAEKAGIPVRVRNYGGPGLVNYQETILLSLLVTGGKRPDLVVFYDGINDASVQILGLLGDTGPVGEPSVLGADQMRDAVLREYQIDGGSAVPPAPLTGQERRPPFSADAAVSAIATAYQQGIDLSRALASRHHFEVVHLWQPVLYSKATLDPGEQELLPELGLDAFRYREWKRLFAAISTGLPRGVIDLSAALDGAPGPVFSDNAHTNEVGAELVATAMFAELRPRLVRLRASR